MQSSYKYLSKNKYLTDENKITEMLHLYCCKLIIARCRHVSISLRNTSKFCSRQKVQNYLGVSSVNLDNINIFV